MLKTTNYMSNFPSFPTSVLVIQRWDFTTGSRLG